MTKLSGKTGEIAVVARAVLALFVGDDPGRVVPKRWCFRRSSYINRKFLRKHRSDFENARIDDEFRYVTVGGRIFVWPKEAPLEALSALLSELLVKSHPHCYDIEPTIIERGDIVLDVGSCEGAFAALSAEKGAEVIMIEPSVKMASVIRRLFAIRGLPNPDVHQCLLGKTEGRLSFVDNPMNPGASRVVPVAQNLSYPVVSMTLDHFVSKYCPRGISYLKCDAEGHDYDILCSGKSSLQRHHPKIAVTTYHNQDDFEKISLFLKGLGYTCTPKGLLFTGGGFRPIMLHARWYRPLGPRAFRRGA